VVPELLKMIAVRSVVDVGCGIGTWSATFLDCGVADVLGIDGAYVDEKMLMIPQERFLAKDLEAPLRFSRSFDLAVSVEVAEHLSAGRAQSFVADLVRLAPCVLFSAAVPGQGGTDHKNEQWPGYWKNMFHEHGYRPIDCLRSLIWDDPKVEWWYRQNLLLFCRAEEYSKYSHLEKPGPLEVVHPCNFEIKAHELRSPNVAYLVQALPGALTRDSLRFARRGIRYLRRTLRSNRFRS
jgi:SAM-dependent methyltransferase